MTKTILYEVTPQGVPRHQIFSVLILLTIVSLPMEVQASLGHALADFLRNVTALFYCLMAGDWETILHGLGHILKALLRSITMIADYGSSTATEVSGHAATIGKRG